MKYLIYLHFILILFLSITAYAQHELIFDNSGKLISNPPELIRGGHTIQFSVAFEPKILRQRALETFKNYKKAYLKIQQLDNYLNQYYSSPPPNVRAQFIKVKNALAFELETRLYNGYKLNAEVALPALVGAHEDLSLVANAQNIVEQGYEVTIFYLDDNGILLSKSTRPLNTKIPTAPHTPNKLQLATRFKIPNKARRITYEIREHNGVYDEIRRLLTVAERPEALDTVTNESLIPWVARIDELSSFNKIIKRKIDSLSKPSIKVKIIAGTFRHNSETQRIINLLRGIEKSNLFVLYASKIIAPLQSAEWLSRFAWLNNGQLIANPFLRPSVSQTVRLKELNQQLTDKRRLLSSVEEQLKLVSAMLSNNEPIVPSSFNHYLDKQANLLKQKTEFDGSLAELQQQRDEILEGQSSQKNDWGNRKIYLTQDKLLYKGNLWLSEPDRTNNWDKFLIDIARVTPKTVSETFTRYHDATRHYQLTSLKARQKVTENDRMIVQVENQNPDRSIRINYKPEQLQYALSALEEDIGKANRLQADSTDLPINALMGVNILREDFVSTFNITARNLLDSLNDFTSNYELASKLSKVFQFGNAELPLVASSDTISTYNSVFLDTPTSLNAPYKVPYSIKTGKDSTLTSESLNLSYQVDMLHRFRFKIGFVYSGLQKFTYNLDKNPPTRITDIRGLDFTFGLQTFLGRIDIQDRKPGIRPFAFIGFLLKERPYENYILGLGSEVLNGLGISGGIHIGRSQRLSYQSGTFVDGGNYWKIGPYVSLLLDLSIFNTVFNFSRISNPF
jgi:hypothetical protein